MRKTLIIGKNSFLARRFFSSVGDEDQYLAVSHRQAFDKAIYRDVDCVINFAINPAYRYQPYQPENDMCAQVAEVVARSAPESAHYIMLSSRAVYAPEMAMGAREEITGEASSIYGRNKKITEQRISAALGERVGLLRVANVIGDEHGSGRLTFMAQALERLVTHKEILLDVSPEVCRDFLPDNHFARMLEAICEDPPAGAMNVGSGLPVPIGSVARWIIEGYGEGVLRISDSRRKDEFWLDVAKFRARYGFRIKEAEIEDHCRTIGFRLRDREPTVIGDTV